MVLRSRVPPGHRIETRRVTGGPLAQNADQALDLAAFFVVPESDLAAAGSALAAG